jgi:hypothetical protein
MSSADRQHVWLLLVYKVMSEPTAHRVYVWRKLKRLGALLHDAVWVLPATPWTRERLQWLAAEIGELAGEVMLWESREALPGEDVAPVRQFLAQADTAYAEIIADLQRADADLAALSWRYQQILAQDYIGGVR